MLTHPVLVVDDSSVDLELARECLESLAGAEVRTTTHPGEVLEFLTERPGALVVTDLNMPFVDGFELTRRIRDGHPDTPVVVMTSHGSEATAATALHEGAAGYVSKHRLAAELRPVVEKVLKSIETRNGRSRVERILAATESSFTLENDIGLVPPLVGYLQEKVARLLPLAENELLRLGLAVHEAVTNAVYHGNLEVDSALRDSGEFWEVARRRSAEPPWAARRVNVTARVTNDEFVCVVRDEGPGFDVAAVPDPTAPENALRPCGRGLFLIRHYMDLVDHNASGNEITMTRRVGGNGSVDDG